LNIITQKIIIFILLLSISFSLEKKVLFIGIDGCRADALEVANTPNMDGLIQNGLYENEALSSIDGQATYSGPGWSSMITGVWMNKHGVYDNSFNGSNYDEYPPFTTLLEENGDEFNMASFIMWSPIHTNIFNGSMDYNELHSEFDGSIAISAANYLQTTSEIDVLFIDFDHVDHAGHSYGFGPQITNYTNVISEVDSYIGLVLDALENRPTYSNEDWLIIITSDHGGNSSGHGGQSLEERLIPIILSGNSVDEMNRPNQLYITDLVPTLIHFLGQDINCDWELDGKSFGLNLNNFPEQQECPSCPTTIQPSINYSQYQVELSWQENEVNGFQYFIYRNQQLIAQLDGYSNYYIDTPNLTGVQGNAEFTYSVNLESFDGNQQCSSEISISIPTGIILLNENFDYLELNTAVDEGLIENGGCTNAIPEDVLGWTNEPPQDWTIDNSQMPNIGTTEWRGWSFATKEFWISAEDQLRSQFHGGNHVVAIADSDEWDDCGNAASSGNFNSTLSSPMISVPNNNEIQLSFNSHFRNEAPQQIYLTVQNLAGVENTLLHYSNDSNSDNNGEDALNEFLQFSLNSNYYESIQFNWSMADAGNNWFWAIDNVLLQLITPALGDLNNDSNVNILDVILIVNIILGQMETDDILLFLSDINRDRIVNVVDIIQLVNFIVYS